MIFRQLYLGCLSHASYLVGDESTRRAVVVDPRRDVDIYVDEAAAEGLRIERVIETHLHADFLSGHLELAARTGAVISFGDAADVEFPIERLQDGARLSLGDVTLVVLATPGHTPESICLVVYEHADDAMPFGVLTGDTLFVGDVGRPDLLATASAQASADALARQLYHSLHDKLLQLPDATGIFPAHGAGSACGKQVSTETSSTLGEQRASNYALQAIDEDSFVAAVTEGRATPPGYFSYDADRNRQVRPLLDETPPPLLSIDDVLARAHGRTTLLDTREPAEFAAGHLRNAVNVGLQGRFAEWAADVLRPEDDIILVGDPASAVEAKTRLGRVGYDRVVGRLDDPATVFRHRADLIDTGSRLTIEQLAELRGLEPSLQLVDVRSPSETATGTLPNAREIPLATLRDALDGLDRASPVVVYCESGYRSQIAASVMSASGFSDVSDLLGGYGAWDTAGLPTTTTHEPTSTVTPQVGARAAKSIVDSGGLLLDVREHDEWDLQHAPAARLLPMGQVRAHLDELPRDRRIVVVCRSGGRSAAVTDVLRASEFDAVNLAGGMSAWAAAGLPVATARAEPTTDIASGLIVHRTEPLNCETSIPALIGGVVMPNARFYVRNHFPTPTIDGDAWRLNIGGLVERPLQLSLHELQRMPAHSRIVTLECAGNGRAALDPPVAGEQWRLGAVSTAEWTGVSLTAVLDRAQPTATAHEVLLRGADHGTVDDRADEISFERSLTLDDARHGDALLAYAMNGEALPVQHGYPVRLIMPGWYAVASVKWLTHIDLVDTPFTGYYQRDRYIYEWPHDNTSTREPVRLQQVRALITEPTDDAQLPLGDLVIRGVAWSGAAPIARVDVRINDGVWQPTRLIGDGQRGRWQWWELLTHTDQPGALTIHARATDMTNRTQPDTPRWNRLGYGANAIQAVHICIA